MKSFFITSALLLATVLPIAAQTEISGIVVEKNSGKALPGASVVIKNEEGKIKKFASTKADGSFRISLGSSEGMTLEVSMISFAKQTLSLNEAKSPIKIMLEPESLILKEVSVKSEKIREQGDTVTYSVGSFAQAQDRRKALKDEEYYMNNREAIAKARFGSSVKFSDSAKEKKPWIRERYILETDY